MGTESGCLRDGVGNGNRICHDWVAKMSLTELKLCREGAVASPLKIIGSLRFSSHHTPEPHGLQRLGLDVADVLTSA